MPAQVLGVGWEFPVALKGKGIGIAHYEACVRNSIFLILSTAKGERVMRPDFGCGLHELVFNVNGPSTQGMAEFHVREALEKWEPRIDVMRVRASGAGGYGEQLLIEIDYRVRLTDNRFNLVYPFYLDRPLT
ncbi:GPW/gp25 family protein (plasmid) [Paraburkholderia caribensis MBA4]|uniref:GPW/gp25 family protein n=1 Tax=Paraburkholderia caribensis MBA4 TaxID=1323664 RepID=A0A0P0RPP4_9BURK|nr:GPW/gp25 family protein [Paraburkholderia caribensis]ALL70940.1 GPW/gp25 family protein [Paraburkholderia caribensis MBA4]